MFCILKSIVAWAVPTFVSTNLIGFVLRAILWSPLDVEAPDEHAAVFRMEDGKKVAGKFSDFKVGQTVEASFTGPVSESYPVQGAASEIVILQTR
jgi:hypothetical protein